MNEMGLFDEDFRLKKLAEKGDPLAKLDKVMDWEHFLPILNKVFKAQEKDVALGGRPHYDYVMMFKILVIQQFYNLSDERTEFEINDKLTFMRFLGLRLGDTVPDTNTIWAFREELTKAKAIKNLFDTFNEVLEEKGIIARKGSLVDASFIEIPRQRNTRKENAAIKRGEIPEKWLENQPKLSHKDTDARWTQKNGENYYGYKNHVKADKKSRIITRYSITSANVHDSQAIPDLLDPKDRGHTLYGDSAYIGAPLEKIFKRRGIVARICEKGYKNQPLSREQKRKNRNKSRTRVLIEHIFGFMENSMRGMETRVIGIVRTATMVGLKNLVYNMFRYEQMVRSG
jgi:IS5 family transposase